MHPVTLRREHIRQRVAQRGLASVTDVQRAGRIGRHEFDEHAPAGLAIGAAEGFAPGEHHADHRLLRRDRQTHVDEARSRHFGAFHETLRLRMRNERVRDLLRELPGIGAQRLRELHRDVARDVAVRGNLGPFQRDRRLDEEGFGRALGGLGDLRHDVGEQCFEGLLVCGQHACCESSEAVRRIGRGVGRARRAKPVCQKVESGRCSGPGRGPGAKLPVCSGPPGGRRADEPAPPFYGALRRCGVGFFSVQTDFSRC